MKRLQHVQNSAARVIYLSRKFDHVTRLLIDLHWFPIEQRISFKILLITFKILHDKTPEYLNDLIIRYNPPRALRSSSKSLLHKPCFNLKSYGGRSFTMAASTLWNDLHAYDIKVCNSLATFKTELKTMLFKQCFSNYF